MITNTDLKGAAVPGPIVAGAGDRPVALEFDLAHHLPGRLRLRSAVLKGNALASEEARRHLAQIDGVTSAWANPLTGSVLLEYDPNVISPTNVSDVWPPTGMYSERLRRRPKREPGGPTDWRAWSRIG